MKYFLNIVIKTTTILFLIFVSCSPEGKLPKLAGNKAGEEREYEIAPNVKITFCWCPPGEYLMGSPDSEYDRFPHEKQKNVTISEGFWIAKTETTQSQWFAVAGSNPSDFKGANSPVDHVSWNDIQDFLIKLNIKIGNSDGGQMALPTEAQWEYACRAGENGPFSGGNIEDIAWYEDNSGEETHQVGLKNPNAWGIHDMHGNVTEWCSDWGDDIMLYGGFYKKGDTHRAKRGGNWASDADECRAAMRSGNSRDTKSDQSGFRIIRSSIP